MNTNDLYHITINKMDFIYITANQPVPNKFTEQARDWYVEMPPKYIKDKMHHALDWRMIIVRGADNYAYPYYLLWNDGINLISLDEKVKTNQQKEEDFGNCIFAEYHLLTCHVSKTWWHTLCLPHARFILTGSVVGEIPNKSRYPILNCPITGDNFRYNVIKVLEKAESPVR